MKENTYFGASIIYFGICRFLIVALSEVYSLFQNSPFLISILQMIMTITRSQQCNQPSAKILKQIEEKVRSPGSISSLHESFFLLDRLRGKGKIVNITSGKKYYSFTHFDKKCPKNDAESASSRSTCPHYFDMEYDEYRIPNTLLQARCKCTRCLVTQGKGVVKMTKCRPIYYFTKVARAMECKNNTLVYEDYWEKVSVGCTCAKRTNRVPRDTDSI